MKQKVLDLKPKVLDLKKGLLFETKGLGFEKRPPFEAHVLKFEITLGDISLVHYVNVE